MRSAAGLAKAQDYCAKQKKAGVPGLLWCSIPCTGGSVRNDMNPVRHTESFKKRLRRHLRVFSQIWSNFVKLAKEVHGWGWSIAIEWPASCKYWQRRPVIKLQHELGLSKAHCRGCAMGLMDDANLPIAKPWHIATNDLRIEATLDKQRCPGKEAHPVHSECQGKYAKRSESYTP